MNKNKRSQTTSEIEQRLAALEAAVADLQRQLNPPTPRTWPKGFVPPVADEEAFLKAMELARQYRSTHYPTELGEAGQ
jgi:hypothetical protein